MLKLHQEPASNYLDQIARNHARILNHESLILNKIKIGQRLGLIQSPNLKILDQLQAGALSLNETLSHICQTSQLDHKQVRQLLKSTIPAGHIEFHPTDFCDHNCLGCYYKDKGNDVMPFEFVAELLQIYRPKSVVLVGGGEPTFYSSTKHNFNDLVFEIKRINPSIQIGLVTKGTQIPPGAWQEKIDWIRLSLDASTPKTFFESKGKDAFETVLSNYIKYLKGPIPHVGLGFLFWSKNIFETYEVPALIYKLISEIDPKLLAKTNIQYRPMRPGIDVPEKKRKNHVSAEMICSDELIEKATREFEQRIQNKDEVSHYILHHTNWHKIAEGNGLRMGQPFSYCYYSLAFRIFRPTGEVYPCFVRVSDPEYLLGNYFHRTEEEHLKISLLSYLFFSRERLFCTPDRCRMSWLNNIAEQGIKGKHPKPQGITAQSYFF